MTPFCGTHFRSMESHAGAGSREVRGGADRDAGDVSGCLFAIAVRCWEHSATKLNRRTPTWLPVTLLVAVATSWIYLPSTIRQKAKTMSEVKAAVHQRYRTELADLDRASYEDFVTDRTAELEQAIAVTTASTEHQVIAAWEASMGREADHQERVNLINQARLSAQEIALANLWEGYEDPEDRALREAEQAQIEQAVAEERAMRSLPAMERWKTSAASEAEPEIVRLVEMVWPQQNAAFQVLAEDLLQARGEDRMPLPSGPDDPLAAELGRLVLEYRAELDALAERTRSRP